jgi:hypothetical protein
MRAELRSRFVRWRTDRAYRCAYIRHRCRQGAFKAIPARQCTRLRATRLSRKVAHMNPHRMSTKPYFIGSITSLTREFAVSP